MITGIDLIIFGFVDTFGFGGLGLRVWIRFQGLGLGIRTWRLNVQIQIQSYQEALYQICLAYEDAVVYTANRDRQQGAQLKIGAKGFQKKRAQCVAAIFSFFSLPFFTNKALRMLGYLQTYVEC